jgi:ribulose bisphosphate carboxylase small subunit
MPRMTRSEIEQKAGPDDRGYLQAGSPSTVYAYALKQGWITDREYDDARHYYGASWNYAGD